MCVVLVLHIREIIRNKGLQGTYGVEQAGVGNVEKRRLVRKC